MNRSNFYLDQLVTEEQMDQAFDDVDTAVKNVVKDLAVQGAIGITSGLGVAPTAPESMSVTVGSGVAYQKNGDRTLVADDQTLGLSIDSEGDSTVVPTAGQERWVSIFLLAARALSEPVTDGNEQSVMYRSEESFELEVVQGSAAAEGSAVRPTLRDDAILLADVRIYNGQTVVALIDIKVNRTEKMDVIGPSLQFLLDEDQYRPVGVIRELSAYAPMAYYTEVPIPPTDRVIVKPLAISIGHDDGGFITTEETIVTSTGTGETDVIVFNLDTQELEVRNVSGGVYPTNRDVVLGSMYNDGTFPYPFYMPQRISTLNGTFEGFKWFTKTTDSTLTIYPGRLTMFGREWSNPYARVLNTLDGANWDGGHDPVDYGYIYDWVYVYAVVNTGNSDLNRVEFLFTTARPVWTNKPLSGQLGEGHPTDLNGVYLFAFKFDTTGDPSLTNAMFDGQQVYYNDVDAPENQVLIDGDAGSFTEIDLDNIIPATANSVDLLISIDSPIGSAGSVSLASNVSGSYPNITRDFEGVAGVSVTRRIKMPIAVEQKLYYMVSTVNTTVSINVTGYTEDKLHPNSSLAIPMGA